MEWAGERLIAFSCECCGKSEEAHSIMKDDLAGGSLFDDVRKGGCADRDHGSAVIKRGQGRAGGGFRGEEPRFKNSPKPAIINVRILGKVIR
jgi:hypothetical protein